MDKRSYLVIGLEASCTKFVSKLIAVNARITRDIDDWSGFYVISDEKTLVTHRSLPHGERDNFISLQEAEFYDKIIICTRDFNSSLLSKNKEHQSDIKLAYKEHVHGASLLQKIVSELGERVHIFSYESALMLQEIYLYRFLNEIGLKPINFPEVKNINLKYMNYSKLGEIVEYHS